MSIRVHPGTSSYPRAVRAGPVVTVGNFDGVHVGHQALAARVAERAAAAGAPAVAITFDPMPREVLRPDAALPRLQRLDDRIAALAAAGITDVVLERFDRDYAAHDAAWFAREVLGARLGASAVVLGWDFRFGRERSGAATDVAQILAVPVETVPAVAVAGEVVSSSRVRAAIAAGEVALAAQLLGRPHTVHGRVVHGDARGRTIGFPTANVGETVEVLPENGVYAVTLDGRPAVANLGVRPTVDGTRRALEVHVLDFAGDLYGREVAVAFVARLREERKFAGLEALVAQIRADALAARQLLLP